MEIISVNEFKIELTRKRVKNVSLRILKGGKLKMTAPFFMPRAELEKFALTKYGWIKKHISAATGDDYMSFVSNGKVKIFGEEIPTPCEGKELEKFLKKLLTAKIDERLPLWSEKTELKPSGYVIRNMKTRWGTCNVKTHKLCFNLQLVKKPLVCLDYVIVHELGHIVNPRHDKRFYKYMDNYFTGWREVKKLLNH